MDHRTEEVDRAALAKREFQGAMLGDARRAKRLQQIVTSVAKRPDASIPRAMCDEAALEATYRFLGNEAVTPDAILGPHLRCTIDRVRHAERTVVAFDTTELRFGGAREELGYLTRADCQSRGLFAHVGLAIDLANGEPLGVVHLETMIRRKPKARKNAHGALDNESLRWHRGAAAVHGQIPDAICVMDREADIFTLVTEMSNRSQSFVIRASHMNRLTEDGPLWEQLDETELITTREIDLPERTARTRESARKKYPPRSAHRATLELRSRRVKLMPPKTWKAAHAAAVSVEVQLVHVIERNPPAGDAPIEWLLFTNLPAVTANDVDVVVDAYHARWLIEELFKALKSGCAFEKRQLESPRTVTNALAVFLPIAWLLLRLRHVSRTDPERPGADMLSPLMLACLGALLQKQTRRTLSDQPTCREITWAIAALGGHIRNNGEPGFMVLGRGLADLLSAVQVAEALGWSPEM